MFAHGELAGLFLEPDTGLDHCPRILLSCFRTRTSQGKCRFIGVSNYSVPLLAEMETYANAMPAVNQLELHPRYASPALREYAREKGIHLTAYGTANSVLIEQGGNSMEMFFA